MYIGRFIQRRVCGTIWHSCHFRRGNSSMWAVYTQTRFEGIAKDNLYKKYQSTRAINDCSSHAELSTARFAGRGSASCRWIEYSENLMRKASRAGLNWPADSRDQEPRKDGQSSWWEEGEWEAERSTMTICVLLARIRNRITSSTTSHHDLPQNTAPK